MDKIEELIYFINEDLKILKKIYAEFQFDNFLIEGSKKIKCFFPIDFKDFYENLTSDKSSTGKKKFFEKETKLLLDLLDTELKLSDIYPILVYEIFREIIKFNIKRPDPNFLGNKSYDDSFFKSKIKEILKKCIKIWKKFDWNKRSIPARYLIPLKYIIFDEGGRIDNSIEIFKQFKHSEKILEFPPILIFDGFLQFDILPESQIFDINSDKDIFFLQTPSGMNKFADILFPILNISGIFNDYTNFDKIYSYPKVWWIANEPNERIFDKIAYELIYFWRRNTENISEVEIKFSDWKNYMNKYPDIIYKLSKDSKFKEILEFFQHIFIREKTNDVIIDFVTFLESIFTRGKQTELNFRCSINATLFLSSDWNIIENYYDFFNRIYDLRSKIVHGGNLKKAYSRFFQTQLVKERLNYSENLNSGIQDFQKFLAKMTFKMNTLIRTLSSEIMNKLITLYYENNNILEEMKESLYFLRSVFISFKDK